MKFGVYIRNKRESRGWTQPEAAEKAEIEQSYLSKLETGKSYPSEDIFNRLVTAYDIDSAEMSQQLFSGELDKLREIKQVRQVVLERQKSNVTVVRGWLIAGLACLMLGAAFFSFSLHNNDKYEYRYRSNGVILPGEALDVFNIIEQKLASDQKDPPDADEFSTKKQNMIDRIHQNDLISNTDRGASFVQKVFHGKRHYVQFSEGEVRADSNWLLAAALMLVVGGFGCFFISFRWK